MSKLSVNQQKTLDSFVKIDEYISMLTYYNAYKLDKILLKGCKSTLGLLKFMVSELKIDEEPKVNNKNNEFACSCFDAVTPDGGHIMGRNFDYMDAPLIVVWTAPKNGYKSISVANCTFMLYGKQTMEGELEGSKKKRLLFAPYCGMDGINEKGLAISILEIKTKATNQKDPNKKDITTTTIVRAVLDKCATVDDAVKEFAKYNMHDAIFTNYHYLITDNNGESIIIEYVNNEMKVIKDKKPGCQRVTNFFISEGGDNAKAFGRDRFNYMEQVQNNHNGILTEEEAMKVLENANLNYKHRRGYMIISLWSAVYNSKDCSMTLCAGLDYDKVYKFYVDKPGKFEKLEKKETSIETFEFTHKDREMDNWDVNLQN